MEETEICICKCNSIEHQVVFTYFTDNKEIEGDVYMTIHLIPDSFLKRLINGIKYIFGHRSKYGDFDEFIFNRKDADKLQKVVNYLKS